MIPPVLLIGTVVGFGAVATGGHRSRLVGIATAALAALAWGLLVGVGNSSFGTFAGGTMLAAANLVAGAVPGVVCGWITRRSRSPRSPGLSRT